MGFTIAEEVKVDRLGLSVAGAYVTIRATFAVSKGGAPMMMPLGLPTAQLGNYTYSAQTRYSVYAQTNTTGLDALLQDTVTVGFDTFPENVVTALYTAIKAKFPGLTFTDC